MSTTLQGIRAETVLGSLLVGASRYFAQWVSPVSGTVERRSCVRWESGRSFFEFPHTIVAGGEKFFALHIVAGQGSVGNAVFACLNNGHLLATAHSFNPFHRLKKDLEDAIKQSGLWMINLEFRNVCRLKRGPWALEGPVQPRGRRSAAQDYFEVCDAANPIFQALHEDIAECSAEISLPDNFGPEERLQQTWEWARWPALGRPAGSVAASRVGGRAFGMESRTAQQHMWADLMVLLWLGYKRGGTTSSASPLLRRASATAPPGAEDEPPLPSNDARRGG